MNYPVKRFGYISGIVIACMLSVLGALLLLVRSSKVQTAALGVFTQEISRGLQAEVKIGRVDYRLFNRIEIEHIYIGDQQHDTLLYIDTLRARFDFKGFFRHRIIFRQAEVTHALLNTYQTADGRMNFAFLTDLLPKEKSSGTERLIEVKNVRLNDIRLRYNDIYIDSLQAALSLNHYATDSLNAAIEYLSLYERGGFVLQQLEAGLIVTSQSARMPQLHVVLPHSELRASVAEVRFPETGLTPETLHKTAVRLQLNHATLSPQDIGRFVPALKNISGQIAFSCDLSGTIDSLNADGLSIDYRHYQLLRGNVAVHGLPNLDTACVHARLQDLTLHKALLQDFLSDMQNRPYQLPAPIARLGVVHYKGDLNGRIDSLILRGAFHSQLGTVSTNGSLTAKNRFSEMYFRGSVQTKRFKLGKLLDNKQLGNISLKAQVDAHTGVGIPLRADLNATLSEFDFRGYHYRNARIDGIYTEGKFEGQLALHDPNLDFSFDGLIDLTRQLPVMNFGLQVRHLRFGPLHLSERYADSDLRGQLTINLTGNHLDNINGVAGIDTLSFVHNGKTLFMEQMRIMAETGNNRPTSFKIQSDFLNANISGHYRYSALPVMLQRLIIRYMPRMLDEKTRMKAQRTVPDNDMQFYAYFKNLDSISNVLELPVSLSQMPTVKGFVNEPDEQFALQVVVPELISGTRHIDDIALNLDNRDRQVNFSLQFQNIAGDTPAGKKIGDLSCLLSSVARRDSLYLTFHFTNHDSIRNAGMLHTTTRFTQYADEPMIDLHLLPSEFILSDSVWTLGDSHIRYTMADTTLQVENFRFGNDRHYLYADGLASTRVSDSIRFEIGQLSIDYLLGYTKAREVISFGGEATGWGTVYSLFKAPMFEADLRMDSASINGSYVGDAAATATWNRTTKAIDIAGRLTEANDTVAIVTGVVTPQNRCWELFIKADSVNLGFINGWTSNILDDITGRGFGNVHVFGANKKTYVEAKALAKDAGIGVGILGTRYFFTDSVTMETDKILFTDITLHDKEGNPVHIDGKLTHDGNFQELRYEILLDCKQALAMDLPAVSGDMFYGKVYATGNASIRGDAYECRISADAQTDPHTEFNLSIANASNARDNSFITFVNRNEPPVQDKPSEKNKLQTKVFVDLQIEATPAAMVNIIIDPKTGDHLNGRGSGNLKLEYDVSADDIKLFGTYTLEQGSFFFTFQNVIRKEFTIRSGSKVIFTGNPENPQIDASAHYSTTASLRDLFGSDFAELSTNRTSVPVNCILYLKGNLLNPVISFGIELPQSDESVASQVRSIINTDEMMMRQILYLLVFNRFYTPEYLQTNTGNIGVNETYSLLSSTITGQINNWISKLTKDFSLGFNVRTDGSGGDASQEYETQFQYQPNNRLIINGNFGYRYNDISNQPIFGNLDVEYILSQDGHWRAKAYTHTVDKYSLKEAHTVQGLGFMFKYDFGGQGGRKKKTPKAVQDTTAVLPADTVQKNTK